MYELQADCIVEISLLLPVLVCEYDAMQYVFLLDRYICAQLHQCSSAFLNFAGRTWGLASWSPFLTRLRLP